MRLPTVLIAAGSLAACAAEEPRHVSPEAIEAAADHAQLEMERAAPAGNLETRR